MTDTSALELITPDSWVTMDGCVVEQSPKLRTGRTDSASPLCRFEFATNEYINDITVVTLETAATETGLKDFIAVGTTIDRGEDLAVKGAVSRSLVPPLSVLLLPFYVYGLLHEMDRSSLDDFIVWWHTRQIPLWDVTDCLFSFIKGVHI